MTNIFYLQTKEDRDLFFRQVFFLNVITLILASGVYLLTNNNIFFLVGVLAIMGSSFIIYLIMRLVNDEATADNSDFKTAKPKLKHS